MSQTVYNDILSRIVSLFSEVTCHAISSDWCHDRCQEESIDSAGFSIFNGVNGHLLSSDATAALFQMEAHVTPRLIMPATSREARAQTPIGWLFWSTELAEAKPNRPVKAIFVAICSSPRNPECYVITLNSSSTPTSHFLILRTHKPDAETENNMLTCTMACIGDCSNEQAQRIFAGSHKGVGVEWQRKSGVQQEAEQLNSAGHPHLLSSAKRAPHPINKSSARGRVS
ncbi:hypothetical protein QQF64_022294 [Cirrhinus molitorella]|uniref:Uncharacterized protein n=1 Tax=Cirrhinus molitorella TaxID=172907 RepID=A0ABR3L7S8_9TELE